MNAMLNIAIRAARKAGDIIARSCDQLGSLTVTTKSKNDYVSEVDQRAEQAIIETLAKAYPDHSILAEESGQHSGNEFEWIIDPLDGTTNFLRGIPQYAVSIGLRHKGKFQQAVVYDPIKQELFTASRGEGAQLNNKRIRVSQCKGIDGALFGTGIPFREGHLDILDDYLGMMQAMIPGSAGIRRAGSAALDLAYVAAGRFDGFWEYDLNQWDMAAGVLLVEEAGGLVSDFSGGFEFMESGNIIAATPKLFKEMLKIIQPRYRKKP
jgi:myo-inositol-1(or 4)-monophosphatase